MELDIKFTAACATMRNVFGDFKAKLQEDLKNKVMVVSADQVAELQLQYKYLEELHNIVNNEEIDL